MKDCKPTNKYLKGGEIYMKELSENKLIEICNNYINGNRTHVKKAIKKLNKLQIANLMIRCSDHGVPRHNMYTQVQFALE